MILIPTNPLPLCGPLQIAKQVTFNFLISISIVDAHMDVYVTERGEGFNTYKRFTRLDTNSSINPCLRMGIITFLVP